MTETPNEKEGFSFQREESNEYKFINDTSLQQPKSLFSLLIERIKKTFQPTVHDEGKLSGRVQQLNQTSIMLLQRLRKIKEKIKQHADEQLFIYVSSLLDPLVRSITGIQRTLMQHGSVIMQAKAFKKYSNWVIKAELWVGIESNLEDEESITRAMILHIKQEADELIDQDLQVIRDYEEHILDSLPLNDDEMNLLKNQIETELTEQVINLEKLKEKPEVFDLQTIFAWKDDVDRRRSKYFDRALHIIDEIIYKISPTSSSEEVHDHLVEVLTQIVYLEEEIPSLVEGISEERLNDPIYIQITTSKIDSFEQELHELNLNLRLTPDLYDRLQLLSGKLGDAKKIILIE